MNHVATQKLETSGAACLISYLQKQAYELVAELCNLHKSRAWDRDTDNGPALPRFISDGNGKQIRINEYIEKRIFNIAKQWLSENRHMSMYLGQKDAASLVRDWIGPIIANTDLEQDFDVSAADIINKIKSSLSLYVGDIKRIDYIFGCHIFSNNSVLSVLPIGPVIIYRRNEWLKHALERKIINLLTYNRISKKWGGAKVAKRKPSYESMLEDDILDSVGECSYICHVSIHGYAADFTQQRALMAARLSLTFIALCWESPSNAFEGISLSYDRDLYHRHYISFADGKLVTASSQKSMRYGGIYVGKQDWARIEKNYDKNFEIYAELLNFLIGPRSQIKREKLMNAFSQAFFWFHEASREKVDVIAIVKYVACMEALADAGKSKAILKLLQARVGLKLDEALLEDGRTAREIVNDLYRHGRSDTIHGNNSRLMHDWTEMRSIAQLLSRLSLLNCTEWAFDRPNCSKPMDMQRI